LLKENCEVFSSKNATTTAIKILRGNAVKQNVLYESIMHHLFAGFL